MSLCLCASLAKSVACCRVCFIQKTSLFVVVVEVDLLIFNLHETKTNCRSHSNSGSDDVSSGTGTRWCQLHEPIVRQWRKWPLIKMSPGDEMLTRMLQVL